MENYMQTAADICCRNRCARMVMVVFLVLAAWAGAGGRPHPVAAIGPWVDTPIRGYANKASINKGEAIEFHVGTTRASYNIEVYRVGWYGGTGSKLITIVNNLPGVNYPIPQPDSSTGLLELTWPVAYTLQTDSAWAGGVYITKLIANDGSIGNIIFVVRDDAASADIVYQLPVTTYQAYNPWGGKSLYSFNSTDGVAAVKVSFDRPYSEDGTANFWKGDYGMIRFLESRGYHIKYVTSLDTHTMPGMLDSSKVFLSNFHDEYWSNEMRNNITAARNAGKHLAFFDANNIYWQIRFENATTNGAPNRVMVCYKSSTTDPMSQINPALTTVLWRAAPVNKPENALLGVMYTTNISGDYAWIVKNSSHWIYTFTGLRDNDSIPGLIGGEIDKVFNNGLTPPGTTILAQSPVSSIDYQNATIYTANSGAIVFDAGTYNFARKVDANDHVNEGVDVRVQVMTVNLLNKMTTGKVVQSELFLPLVEASN
jgi:hypothetical protein